MKTKPHFAFRVDIWDDTGDSIVEHVAGVDDFEVATAASSQQFALRATFSPAFCGSYPSSVGMGDAFFRTFVPAAKAAIGSL